MIPLNFTGGTVTHDDLSRLQDVAVARQTGLLKEDMLQVEFAGGLLLDVGWYPEFDATGGFRINVIKNYDWDLPVLVLTAHETAELVEKLDIAQNAINGELRNASLGVSTV
ncbi:hypothetical protein B7453_23715 [Pseudomonas sp. IB20]|uniref:hypothetical protein n=1 Tax=Pseudomonas TaxID=286 RepID=UPI000BA1478C|nr:MULTISPECIES: hypothetical protein [unclassified Pseudomonas]MCV2228151.1 hypothetical protein [Pseudomonas sp. AU10]OZO02027.1 hypothetical protein B7453_23715 [Pseudomonas sp. IB20]